MICLHSRTTKVLVDKTSQTLTEENHECYNDKS